MNWDRWKRRWEEACEARGSRGTRLQIAPPAGLDDVGGVEEELGFRLPDSFRRVLLEFSASVDMFWFLAEGVQTPFRGIFRGTCQWNLGSLLQLESTRRGWIETCFPDPNHAYDAVWHRKLSIAEVGNGDILALDLRASSAPAVYVSHDKSPIHGWRLGEDFADFIDRWTRLGCPGSEDWQLEPFLPSETSGLDPGGPAAVTWRQWFGISGE